MESRQFEKEDWYAFAGATGWDDGRLPLLAKGNLADGREYVVVLDATGGCLMVQDDEETNNEGGRAFECPFPTQAAALAVARGIGEPCDGLGPRNGSGPHELADFLALGFC